MAFTQTDLDNLDAAIASGHRVVHAEGRRVEYASHEEMMRIRDLIAGKLAAASGTGAGAGTTSQRRGVFRFQFTTSRGD
jgi:hypothetical protein